MTDGKPPRPPRGRPRRPKGFDDVPELSPEEVQRRVDVRGGGTPQPPAQRPLVSRRLPPRREERTGARDSLLLIGLVIVGLVAVRILLPNGPLNPGPTGGPGGTEVAIGSTSPKTIGPSPTQPPTTGPVVEPSFDFNTPSLGPTEPPITAAPTPTPTLRPGQTSHPTPVPTKTPTPTAAPPAVLHVVVSVNDSDGGTAIAADWKMHVTSAGTASPSSFDGVVTPGTSVTLSAGKTYDVTYTLPGPLGYATSSSSNCSSTTGGLPVGGASETCTFLFNDIKPLITVITNVINTGGGLLSAADFTVTATGTPNASFPGSATGRDVGFRANTSFSIDQDPTNATTDYTKSLPEGTCSSPGLPLAATATCTYTFTYVGPPPPAPARGPALLLAFLVPIVPRRWRTNRRG